MAGFRWGACLVYEYSEKFSWSSRAYKRQCDAISAGLVNNYTD